MHDLGTHNHPMLSSQIANRIKKYKDAYQSIYNFLSLEAIQEKSILV